MSSDTTRKLQLLCHRCGTPIPTQNFCVQLSTTAWEEQMPPGATLRQKNDILAGTLRDICSKLSLVEQYCPNCGGLPSLEDMTGA